MRLTVAPALLALCCGALLPLTLAPFDWWPLAIPSIGGWLWLLNRWPRRAALLGFAYGVGKYGLGVSWVYVSMRLYGGASVPLGVVLVGIFVAGLSIFTLVQAQLYVQLCGLPHLLDRFRHTCRRALTLFVAKRGNQSPRKSEPSTASKVSTRVPDASSKSGGATQEIIAADRTESSVDAGQGAGPVPTRATSGGTRAGPFARRWILLDATLFTLVWFFFEWVLVWAFTGFPWLFPGYAHVDTPLGNLIPVGGVSLASLGIVATSAFLVAVLGFVGVSGAGLLRRNGTLIAAGLAALPWLVGFALQPVEWVRPGAAHRVALVQGNVDQAVKWRPETRQSIIDRYREMTAAHWDADLIVWPEAAVTLFAHQAAQTLNWLNEQGERAGNTVVFGIPTAERLPDGGWEVFNSALVAGVGEGRYHKRRLVPFGDYVPLATWLRGVIDFFDLPMSSFSPGSAYQGLLDIGFARAAMGICYEVAYGGLMRRPEADVLLTISNDSWFGESIGPLQHMQIARARALENGRWLLRGTNNGVTAIVDHQGRVVASLPQFERGVLTGEFYLMTGTTPYGRFGDVWLLTFCVAGLIGGSARRMRRDRFAIRSNSANENIFHL